MREWSSLTDAFLDWYFDTDNFTGMHDYGSRVKARDNFAVSRGIPSIFD